MIYTSEKKTDPVLLLAGSAYFAPYMRNMRVATAADLTRAAHIQAYTLLARNSIGDVQRLSIRMKSRSDL